MLLGGFGENTEDGVHPNEQKGHAAAPLTAPVRQRQAKLAPILVAKLGGIKKQQSTVEPNHWSSIIP